MFVIIFEFITKRVCVCMCELERDRDQERDRACGHLTLKVGDLVRLGWTLSSDTLASHAF